MTRQNVSWAFQTALYQTEQVKWTISLSQREFTTFFLFQKQTADKEALEEENFALKHKLDASKTRYITYIKVLCHNKNISVLNLSTRDNY